MICLKQQNVAEETLCEFSRGSVLRSCLYLLSVPSSWRGPGSSERLVGERPCYSQCQGPRLRLKPSEATLDPPVPGEQQITVAIGVSPVEEAARSVKFRGESQ